MELSRMVTIFSIIIGYVGRAESSHSANLHDEEHSLRNHDEEPIPAKTDPYVAQLVEIMNAPEPWDHL